MRLICTIHDDRLAQTFSNFLTSEKIENLLEISKNSDWGSNDYGTFDCRIWVYDEERVDEALKWFDRFWENPSDPRFRKYENTPPAVAKPPAPEAAQKQARIHMEKHAPPAVQEPMRPATMYFLIICVLIFFVNILTSPSIRQSPENIPGTPLFSSPIYKALYYDYPSSYKIIDRIVDLYGLEKLENPQELPEEGQEMLQTFYNTPYWPGFYDLLVQKIKAPNQEVSVNAPLFEDIRQGEAWRLFTPALLHYDIFHLFFNMIWLFVLGKQMEQRLGIGRYLLFILVTGIFSNTAQYLMSGSNFIGFSGILCAMIVFVWVRQKRAPWEGYQLLPVTVGFIAVFVAAMAGLQLVSFLLEIRGEEAIAPPIANTAHLSGALAGYILGRMRAFSWS